MKENTSSDKTIGVYKEDRDKYFGMGNLTIADTPPVLIPPASSVLDDLGLQEIREEMDAEHNRMIRAKYDLAVFMNVPGLYVDADKEKETGPIESIYSRATTPQPVAASYEEIQAAIDAQSICDPQYRKAAKKFLAVVIPRVDEESQKLTAEVVKAKKELAQVQKEYGERVRRAEAALKAFNNGIYEEYKKFEIANSGSTVESGHKVTTSNCRRLIIVEEVRTRRYKMLQRISDEIDNYEISRRPMDKELIKEMARNSRPPIVRRNIKDAVRMLLNMD